MLESGDVCIYLLVRPEDLGGDVGEDTFGHGIQVFGDAGTAEGGSGLTRAKAGDGKSILFRINSNLH